jgi:hypothetical protein
MPSRGPSGLIDVRTRPYTERRCGETAGAVNTADRCRDLQVHHMQSRGLLGDDAEENRITLCARCQGLDGVRKASKPCSLSCSLTLRVESTSLNGPTSTDRNDRSCAETRTPESSSAVMIPPMLSHFSHASWRQLEARKRANPKAVRD